MHRLASQLDQIAENGSFPLKQPQTINVRDREPLKQRRRSKYQRAVNGVQRD
jgi:hypothetical protein